MTQLGVSFGPLLPSRSSASSQPVALPKVDRIGGPVELRREARMEQRRLQFVGT